MTKTGLSGTPASPLFLRPNGVSICGYLFLCLNIALFVYFLADEQRIYGRMTREDSLVENLTAVWLLLGGLLLFATALVERDTLRRRVYTLGYLALIFAAGEEISWGQRIFDYPIPQILRETLFQDSFDLHSTGVTSWKVFNLILYAGTFLLCTMVIAVLLFGKKSVFGIPLPSTLLTFSLLTALCYNYTAGVEEYLSRGMGTIWLLLLVFMFFFRQYELLFVTATTMITALTLVFVNSIDILQTDRVEYDEVNEYLITFGYFWYSLELFVAQKTLRGGGSQWKRWLAEWVRSSLSYFSPACSMTDFLQSPLVITCSFVTCTNLGLMYLGYSSIVLKNTPVHNIYEAIKGREPVILSDFDVYITKGEIIYSKSPCDWKTASHPFFLHITPVVHSDILPSLSFFSFREKGGMVVRSRSSSGRSPGTCLISVPLPKYGIAQIRTGQWLRWEGTWPSDVADYETTYSEIVSGNPLVRSDFDIYLGDNVLIYTKESCTPSDTEAVFFLHVYPSDKRRLPSRRSQYGFDNLDFLFSEHGKLFDDKCIAAVRLPQYHISRIVSGQYTSEGPLWRVEVPLSTGEDQPHEGP